MWRRPRVIAVLVVVASVGLVQLLVRRSPGVTVTTAEVTAGPIDREVLATGTFQPARTTDVGAQVSGTIQSLEADFNTPVRAGQVIARLDPSLFRFALVEAEGQLGQAKGELLRLEALAADAQAKLERASALADQNLIPSTELDGARLTMQLAAADLKGQIAAVAAAESEVSRARIELQRTVIRSPFDGIVINRHVEIGQTLTSTFQTPVLFSIADLREMHLLVDVNEGEVGGVRPGAGVSFRVEGATGEAAEGTIAQVRQQPVSAEEAVATSGSSPGTSTQPVPSPPSQPPATSPSSVPTAAPTPVSYVVVIEVSNPELLLRPGTTAIVNLSTSRRQNVVRIPNTALMFRPSPEVAEAAGQTLETIEPELEKGPAGRSRVVLWRFRDSLFEAVTVEFGIADDSWTELVSGPIAPGERLVTAAAIRK